MIDRSDLEVEASVDPWSRQPRALVVVDDAKGPCCSMAGPGHYAHRLQLVLACQVAVLERLSHGLVAIPDHLRLPTLHAAAPLSWVGKTVLPGRVKRPSRGRP